MSTKDSELKRDKNPGPCETIDKVSWPLLIFFMYEMQNIPVWEIWSQSTEKSILSYFVCYSFYILKTLKFGLQPHKKKLLQLVFE